MDQPEAHVARTQKHRSDCWMNLKLGLKNISPTACWVDPRRFGEKPAFVANLVGSRMTEDEPNSNLRFTTSFLSEEWCRETGPGV